MEVKMQKRIYKSKRKLNYEKTIYGFSVNNKTGQNYCFNRDYWVLPIHLPDVAIKALISRSKYSPGGAPGHGRFKPEIKDDNLWSTYFVWRDCDESYSSKSKAYDKSIYEKESSPIT
jgi:hypothetical protein